MKHLPLFIYLLFAVKTTAQTFNSSPNGSIPDYPAPETCFDVTASGLPTAANSSFGITTVCVNITHTWVGDLRIKLKSPTGFEVILANAVGGSDDNFTNTCFRMDGGNGYIIQGSAPFTGTYIPEQSLNGFNIGMNPNGVWQLCILDMAGQDVGTLHSFSIMFGANPPVDPPPPPGPCGLANPESCLCPDGNDTCDLLPDMTASALIIQQQHTEYPGYITLSNATPNIGWGPMEIHGIDSCFCGTDYVPCSTVQCPDLSYPKQRVHQTIYRRMGNTMTSYNRSAGTMTYHPSHGHVHVDNWAEYTLRRDNGDPNPLNWDIIGEGSKVSFCLINLGDCTNNYGYCVDGNGNIVTQADIPNSPFGVVTGCGIDQGIYTGSLDIYHEGLPGQEIILPADLCNGDYYIVSITDPNNDFLEFDETNNYAVTPITLALQTPVTAPNAQFSYSISGAVVQFYNQPDINSTFLWNFGDGTTSTLQNPTHTYTLDGNYNVTLTVTNQCSGAQQSQTYNVNIYTTSIDENGIKNSLLAAYPNPYSGFTNIVYYSDGKNVVSLELFSILGEKTATLVSGMKSEGEHRLIFAAQDYGLSTGVYFIRFTEGEKSATIRLMEMK